MRKILCMVFILLICFVTTFTYAENEENTNNVEENTTTSTDLQTQRELLKQQFKLIYQKIYNKFKN